MFSHESLKIVYKGRNKKKFAKEIKKTLLHTYCHNIFISNIFRNHDEYCLKKVFCKVVIKKGKETSIKQLLFVIQIQILRNYF